MSLQKFVMLASREMIFLSWMHFSLFLGHAEQDVCIHIGHGRVGGKGNAAAEV